MGEKKDTTTEKICRYCGKPYFSKKRGRPDKGFCCKKCADNYRHHHKSGPPKYQKICEYCGEEYGTDREQQKYCSVECSRAARRTGRTVHKKICPYCGVEFETIYSRNKFCTSTCASRYYGDLRRGEYFCEYCGKPRFSDHPNRHHYCSRSCASKAQFFENAEQEAKRKAEIEQQKWHPKWAKCEHCGKLYLQTYPTRKYCSDVCCYEANKQQHREQYAAAYEPRTFYCAECGADVTTMCGDTRKVYCSEACMNRAIKRGYKRRRAEQMKEAFVEFVDRDEVFVEANGVCQICGLPVPCTWESENEWAATLDHIDPLSEGGLHMKANIQLAHRLCNSLKGTEDEEYRVDWKQMLIEEPGRWNERLDELWSQLGLETEQTG